MLERPEMETSPCVLISPQMPHTVFSKLRN
jgi:hypothetical protein